MDRLSTQHAPLIVALALCLLLSFLSAKIGMAAIIGAFFAGLMFADYAPRWNLLPRVGGITEFLAPFFFFTIGARLDARLFRGEVLLGATVVSLLAILSKVVGCGLPLWREGRRPVVGQAPGLSPGALFERRLAGDRKSGLTVILAVGSGARARSKGIWWMPWH